MPKKPAHAPNAKFMAPVTPDAALAAVVGSQPLPRTEATKKVWDYIKKHGLQDSKTRTLINADANLKAVFNGKSQVSMFEMTKLVSVRLIQPSQARAVRHGGGPGYGPAQSNVVGSPDSDHGGGPGF